MATNDPSGVFKGQVKLKQTGLYEITGHFVEHSTNAAGGIDIELADVGKSEGWSVKAQNLSRRQGNVRRAVADLTQHRLTSFVRHASADNLTLAPHGDALGVPAGDGKHQIDRLAVLVERGGRELPIQPDIVGKHFNLRSSEYIKLTGPEPLELVVSETKV